MRFLFAWQHVGTAAADRPRRPARGRRAARRPRAAGTHMGTRRAAGAARTLRVVAARHAVSDGRGRLGAAVERTDASGRRDAHRVVPSRACRTLVCPRAADDSVERTLQPARTELTDAAQRLLDHLRTRGASFAQEMRAAGNLSDADCREALASSSPKGSIASDGFAGLRAIAASSPNDASASTPPAGGRSMVRLEARHGEAGHERGATRRCGEHAGVDAAVPLRRRLPSSAGARGQRRHVAGAGACLSDARGPRRHSRRPLRQSGMSGEQYALPDAVDRLREIRRSGPDETLVTISGADPLNLTGIVTPGDRIRAAAGNRIVYRNGIPVMAMEGDMLRTLATWTRMLPATPRQSPPAGACPCRTGTSDGFTHRVVPSNSQHGRYALAARTPPLRWP